MTSTAVSTPLPDCPPHLARKVYAQFSRSWLVPATLGFGIAGGTAGLTISALYNRPMTTSTRNVAVKAGIVGLCYTSALVLLTRQVPDGLLQQRLLTHAAAGVTTGFMLGGIVGRTAGALRGSALGLGLSLPLWFVMEGWHRLRPMRETEGLNLSPSKQGVGLSQSSVMTSKQQK